jgi:hypothetical protein
LKVTERVIRRSVILTNAQAREYVGISFYDSGEVPYANVAEAVFRSLDAVMFSGEIELTAAQARGDIYVGVRLKAIGPTSTFTNLMVQSVSTRPHTGNMVVRYGPSAILDSDELLELARACRTRTVYNMPSGRATGAASGGENVDQTATAPVQDTAHSLPELSYDTVSAPA